MARHELKFVREIAVVSICPYRNACSDLSIELGWIKAPLFAGVTAKEFFVKLSPHSVDNGVLRRANGIAHLRDRGEKVTSLAFGQRKAIEFIQCVQIDRNREQLAIDTGENTVLVLAPGSEPRDVIEDDFRVRVKNVRAIFVN